MSKEASHTVYKDYLLAFAGILLPLVLAYLGHIYQESEAKQGIHVKYVEMAIRVLKEPVNPEKTELRKWAVNVLHMYSEVPLHDEAKEHLMNEMLVYENAIDSLAKVK